MLRRFRRSLLLAFPVRPRFSEGQWHPPALFVVQPRAPGFDYFPYILSHDLEHIGPTFQISGGSSVKPQRHPAGDLVYGVMTLVEINRHLGRFRLWRSLMGYPVVFDADDGF